MTTYFTHIDSPVGQLLVLGDGELVTGLYLPNHRHGRGMEPSWRLADGIFDALRQQLAEYFAGERQQFDVPLKLAGTPFQQRVWRELAQIPFGATISYTQLARRIDDPQATRAVGHANGRNPISILVPCHRVIGASGRLTGYAGGVEKKQWLLAWERRVVEASSQESSLALARLAN